MFKGYPEKMQKLGKSIIFKKKIKKMKNVFILFGTFFFIFSIYIILLGLFTYVPFGIIYFYLKGRTDLALLLVVLHMIVLMIGFTIPTPRSSFLLFMLDFAMHPTTDIFKRIKFRLN